MRRIHRFMTKKQEKKFINKIVYIAAIAYPLAGVPQAAQIFITKSADDLSLLSYTLFFLLELIFLAYGFVNRLKPIILTSFLWLGYYVAILVGIAIY